MKTKPSPTTSTSFFRVVKRSASTGKFVTREQSGASGRHVVSVRRGTYKKGVSAASKVLKEKELT